MILQRQADFFFSSPTPYGGRGEEHVTWTLESEEMRTPTFRHHLLDYPNRQKETRNA